MKQKLLMILISLISIFSYGQTLIPPSPIVGVGFGVEKGQTITVDSLNFADGQVLLMQDNSTLIIRYKITGAGIIEYGDVGDLISNTQQVEIPRNEGGFNWIDHRDPSDVNGKVIFLQCQDPAEFQITFGEYVDFEYLLQPTLTVDVPSTLLSCITPLITLTASSNDNTVTYLWSNGETTPSISVASAGTYNVTISNGATCSVTSEDYIITQDIGVPIVNAGEPQSINCLVSEVTLGNATSETNVSYLWSNGEITPEITVNVAGTYTLTATNDITGCTASDVVVVTDDTANPIVTITGDYPSLSCTNNQVILTTNVDDSTYTYLWDSLETTQQITVTSAGIYGVTVTDAVSGCVTYENIIIDDNTTTIVATDSGDVEICAGESTNLTAFGGSNYEWVTTGETTPTITVSPTSTTVYTYNVYNGVCMAQGTVTVTVYQQPIATVDADMTIFEGETRTLTAGGGSTYSWSTGETTETIDVNPIVTTTYNVTVTNGTCSDTTSVTITVITPPDVIANVGNDIVICNGDNVILSVNEVIGATYLWSNGMTTPTITVSPLVTTLYSVTITSYGKTDIDYVMVRVNQICP